MNSIPRLLFGWGVLMTSACTLGLDWNRTTAVVDANTMESDLAEGDLPLVPYDTPEEGNGFDLPTLAVDTGPGTDSGAGPSGNCGDRNERCCALGRCNPGGVCQQVDGSFLCVPCGSDGQRCCAFGACANNHFCTQRAGDPMPLCRACGGRNEPCCLNRWCRDGRRCELRTGLPYPTCQ